MCDYHNTVWWKDHCYNHIGSMYVDGIEVHMGEGGEGPMFKLKIDGMVDCGDLEDCYICDSGFNMTPRYVCSKLEPQEDIFL